MLIHKHSVKHNVVQTYREGGQPSALRLREELKRRLLGPRQMRYPPHKCHRGLPTSRRSLTSPINQNPRPQSRRGGRDAGEGASTSRQTLLCCHHRDSIPSLAISRQSLVFERCRATGRCGSSLCLTVAESPDAKPGRTSKQTRTGGDSRMQNTGTLTDDFVY